MAKKIAQALAVLLCFPFALLAGFGRAGAVFTIFSHLFALGPGLPGDYLRAGYYKLTLRSCSINTRIAFGSYFVNPSSSVGSYVSIGSFCVIASVSIGSGAQIGSHVLIPGGQHQHARDADGNLTSQHQPGIAIGGQCWIGDGAILMAGIGEKSTVGAGSVVTKPVPAGVTAVGNPARILGEPAG